MLTPRRLAIRRAVSSRRAVLASNKCRCGLRRAGVEGRFRRVFHVKLYAVGSVFTAQLCCNVKRAVDPRDDPGCKDHITVHHHSLVDGHSAKERREMLRRPAFDQTRRTTNKHAGADGENAYFKGTDAADYQHAHHLAVLDALRRWTQMGSASGGTDKKAPRPHNN